MESVIIGIPGYGILHHKFEPLEVRDGKCHEGGIVFVEHECYGTEVGNPLGIHLSQIIYHIRYGRGYVLLDFRRCFYAFLGEFYARSLA